MTGVDSGSTPPQDLVSERYELLERLGAGGMASVWHGRDRVLRRDVAVKVFNPVPATDEQSADEQSRATREARVLAGMNHPNLVAVLDAGGATPERLDYLVMELMAGPTLRDRIHRRTVRPEDVLRLGAELSAALAYVHARGVVHRDLKPANILFSSYDGEAQAKIADFGIARLLAATPLTTTGVLVGTAAYLSPEQATGAQVGTESDVYALGLVLLECVTGTPAFEGEGVAAAAARLHHDPDTSSVPDPRTRRLLSAMTSREPSARPDAATAAEGFEALASGDTARFDGLALGAAAGTAAAGEAEQTTQAMAAPTQIAPAATASTEAIAPVPEPVAAAPEALPLERRRSRVSPLAVLAGVLVAGVLAVGAVLLGSSDRSPSPGPSAPSAVATDSTTSKSREPTSSSSRATSSASKSSDDDPTSTAPEPTSPTSRSSAPSPTATKTQPSPTGSSRSSARPSPKPSQATASSSTSAKATPAARAATPTQSAAP